jgi:uncharacterized protein YprB with RNaseH-like and TPR domain
MADDELRARLEALNRAPLPSPSQRSRKTVSPPITEAAPKAIVMPPSVRRPRQVAETKSPKSSLGTGECPKAGLLRRGEVVETAVGPHWQVALPLDQLWPGGTKLVEARQQFLNSQSAAATAAVEPNLGLHPEFAALLAALPDRAVALDLETCGLAGSALFLIGLLRQVGGIPTVQLLLARNYAEEAAVLDSFWRIVVDHDVLLTFNGKSFDWPMVIERSIRHRLQFDPPVGWAQPTGFRAANHAVLGGAHPANTKVHIDVLHHARQRWRRQLPNCRLLTLEQHVCRRTRSADIPGHAIPGVYAAYVRTGFEREMDTVLYHNALDLVTLFDLAHRLAA